MPKSRPAASKGKLSISMGGQALSGAKTSPKPNHEENGAEAKKPKGRRAAVDGSDSSGSKKRANTDNGRDSNDDDNSSSEEDIELPRKLKSKKSKLATEEEFAGAMAEILGQGVQEEKGNMPIMAKNRATEKRIEEEKLEYKAKKALAAEKRARLSKDRVIPDMTNFEYEKRLRKVATRGVVKLFNVVKAQQVEIKQIAESKPSVTKEEQVSALSKSKFLDLLKSGSSRK
ncbi:pre-60S ribosomal particles component, partial [Spiromyces aspiralis]